MRLLPLLLFGLVGFAQPDLSQAQAPSSGPSAFELMHHCLNGTQKGSISDPNCVGYLSGFVGAVRIAATVSEDFPICLPDRSIPNTEIVSDVSNYLEQNQDKLQASARSIVFLVLTLKHPCSNNGGKGGI